MKQRLEVPLTRLPVNESLLNRDERSPGGGVGCLDTQRARKPGFTGVLDDKVLRGHFSNGKCWTLSQVVHVAPTVSDEAVNAECPPLLTSMKGLALECNMSHYEADPH